MPDRFRFGIGPADLDLRSGPHAWTDLARRAEALGYSSLQVGDHPAGTIGSGAGPFALLTAATLATTTLRVGALVLGADFRPAAVVAQEAAAIQHLSGGRLELGLGAGWAPADYAATGVPYDGAATRIERLAEVVAVVRRLLAGEACDHVGEHLTVHVGANPLAGLLAAPPVLVLGGGGRRMLELAAREADVVTLNVSLARGMGAGSGAYVDATAAATDRKLAIVDAVLAAARTARPRPERQLFVHRATIIDDRDAVVDQLAASWDLPPAEVLASPHVLVGPVDEVVDRLEERRARWGISYLTWSARSADSMAPVVARLAGT